MKKNVKISSLQISSARWRKTLNYMKLLIFYADQCLQTLAAVSYSQTTRYAEGQYAT